MSTEPEKCIETAMSLTAVEAMVTQLLWRSHDSITPDEAIETVESLLMAATMAEHAAEDSIPGLTEYVRSELESDDEDSPTDIFEALTDWSELAASVGLVPYIIHAHPVDEEEA